MKRCGKCGTEHADNVNFCVNCGNKLSLMPTPDTKVDNKTDNKSDSGINPEQPKKKGKAGKIIKRVAIGIVAAVVILVLYGMHLADSTTYVTLNSEGELFAKAGGSSKVNIDYDGYLWSVNYKPDWVKVNEHDNSFDIVCEPNTTGRDREDHITVKSGKVVVSLPVGQYGQTQYIHLSENSLRSDRDGGNIHIDMETDGQQPLIEFPDFCRVEDMTNEGFTLVVPSNGGYSRSGVVKVSEDNVSATISLSQEGICSNCEGQGSSSCNVCGGLGYSGYGMYTYNCYYCNGGRIQCGYCRGTGIR